MKIITKKPLGFQKVKRLSRKLIRQRLGRIRRIRKALIRRLRWARLARAVVGYSKLVRRSPVAKRRFRRVLPRVRRNRLSLLTQRFSKQFYKLRRRLLLAHPRLPVRRPLVNKLKRLRDDEKKNWTRKIRKSLPWRRYKAKRLLRKSSWLARWYVRRRPRPTLIPQSLILKLQKLGEEGFKKLLPLPHGLLLLLARKLNTRPGPKSSSVVPLKGVPMLRSVLAKRVLPKKLKTKSLSAASAPPRPAAVVKPKLVPAPLKFPAKESYGYRPSLWNRPLRPGEVYKPFEVQPKYWNRWSLAEKQQFKRDVAALNKKYNWKAPPTPRPRPIPKGFLYRTIGGMLFKNRRFRYPRWAWLQKRGPYLTLGEYLANRPGKIAPLPNPDEMPERVPQHFVPAGVAWYLKRSFTRARLVRRRSIKRRRKLSRLLKNRKRTSLARAYFWRLTRQRIREQVGVQPFIFNRKLERPGLMENKYAKTTPFIRIRKTLNNLFFGVFDQFGKLKFSKSLYAMAPESEKDKYSHNSIAFVAKILASWYTNWKHRVLHIQLYSPMNPKIAALIRALKYNHRLEVTKILDRTRTPHNGLRAKKHRNQRR